MTARERRGKRIFLVLAGFLIGERLLGVGLALAQGLDQVPWWSSVARPLLFALAVGLVWRGDTWLRWLVGGVCMLGGGLKLLVSGHVFARMAEATPPEATGFLLQVAGSTLGVIALTGLLEALAGLGLLALPSVRAFLRYQRESRRAEDIQGDE
jgi:hypothetical protein